MTIAFIIAIMTTISLSTDSIGVISSIEGAVTVLGITTLFPVLIAWNVELGVDRDEYDASLGGIAAKEIDQNIPSPEDSTDHQVGVNVYEELGDNSMSVLSNNKGKSKGERVHVEEKVIDDILKVENSLATRIRLFFFPGDGTWKIRMVLCSMLLFGISLGILGVIYFDA